MLFIITYHYFFLMYRQSYDIEMELKVAGTEQVSRCNYDMKNPYYKYHSKGNKGGRGGLLPPPFESERAEPPTFNVIPTST